MPKYGKQCMRKIVSVEVSKELSSRGKPRYFKFTLECGHQSICMFAPHWATTYYAVQMGGVSGITMNCRNCAEGKDPFEARLVHIDEKGNAVRTDLIFLGAGIPNMLFRNSKSLKVVYEDWLGRKKDVAKKHRLVFLDHEKKPVNSVIVDVGEVIKVPDIITSVCYVNVEAL